MVNAVRVVSVVAVICGLPSQSSGTSPYPRPSQTDVIDMVPGIVEPADSVILAAPFDGVLMEIAVREGQTIRNGETVARMDNRVAAAAVQVAMERAKNLTAIHIAEAQLESAQRFAGRVAKAHRHHAASDVELDSAEFAVEQAVRQLEQTKVEQRASMANLQLEKARLAEHGIAAPFDGEVTQIRAKKGESLNRAQEVVSIANMERLIVELQLPLEWFGKLQIGHLCWLSASAPVNDFVQARLVNIEPNVDAATQTFRCRFEIENTTRELPAGFTARLVAPRDDSALASLAHTRQK